MINFAEKSLKGIRTIIFICAVFILVSYGIMMCLSIKPAVIVSGSMEPTIKTGSLVMIDMKYRDAVERDIIAFKAGNIYVAHRVESVTDEGYVTKGDANETADPGVLKKSGLEGRVVMWIPYVGYVIKFVTSLPVIIICTMLIILSMLIQVARGKEAEHEHEKNVERQLGYSDDSHTAAS